MRRVAITATLLFFALVGGAAAGAPLVVNVTPALHPSERPSRPALASPWSSTGLSMTASRHGSCSSQDHAIRSPAACASAAEA